MTTVDELEARIAQLEAQVGQPAVSTLQPNVLTVAPDGTIGADFTGHVHAQGLDLDASTNASPPTADRVRWLRTDNGAVVATLLSYYTGAGGASSLVGQAQSQGTTDNGAAALVALDDLGATRAQLQVTQINRGAMPNPSAIGGNTEVDVGAGNLLKRLLAADGSSHFLQLLSAQKLLVHGPYQATLNVPASSSQAVNLTGGPTTSPTGYIFFGYFNQEGGGWLDHCSWALTAHDWTTGAFSLSFANWSANAATGTWNGYLITNG